MCIVQVVSHAPQVGQLLAVPGVTEALVRLLALDPHGGGGTLVAEAAWVLTYLTAASEGQLQRLVKAGLVPPLLDRLIGRGPWV